MVRLGQNWRYDEAGQNGASWVYGWTKCAPALSEARRGVVDRGMLVYN